MVTAIHSILRVHHVSKQTTTYLNPKWTWSVKCESEFHEAIKSVSTSSSLRFPLLHNETYCLNDRYTHLCDCCTVVKPSNVYKWCAANTTAVHSSNPVKRDNLANLRAKWITVSALLCTMMWTNNRKSWMIINQCASDGKSQSQMGFKLWFKPSDDPICGVKIGFEPLRINFLFGYRFPQIEFNLFEVFIVERLYLFSAILYIVIHIIQGLF